MVLTCIQKPIDIVAFLLVLNFLPLGNNKKSTVTFAKDSFGKMAQSRQKKIILEMPDLEKTPAWCRNIGDTIPNLKKTVFHET